MSETSQENVSKPAKQPKTLQLISIEDIQKHKITPKDLELLPSARSLYSKGRASKSSSGKSEKKTTGVKSTDQYKDADRITKASVKFCTVDRKDKTPEVVAKEKIDSLKSLKGACTNVLKNSNADYREVEKVIRAGIKVLCDTPKPVSTGK